jgi:hypothetical protein
MKYIGSIRDVSEYETNMNLITETRMNLTHPDPDWKKVYENQMIT